MPFEIVRNDIVKMQVDAIVNTANPRPVIGTGVDSAIHKAAGPELLEARKEIGDLAPGTCAATPAFGLNAKYILHTCGPVWENGTYGEEGLLRSAYRSTLDLAAELECESVAFPLLSSGNYGFPKDVALRAAISEFGDFLLEHEMMVYLVVFGEDAYRLSSNLFASVDSYIDEHYVAEKAAEEYAEESAGLGNLYGNAARRRRAERDFMANLSGAMPAADYSDEGPLFGSVEAAAPSAAPKRQNLADKIAAMDATWADTLIALIDDSGHKRSYIYNKANVSKQVFSKINSDSNYQPSKPTAIAFCLALELDVEESQALLAKAGFTLSQSILFDVIISCFIENKDYNLVMLNIALHDYDMPTVP